MIAQGSLETSCYIIIYKDTGDEDKHPRASVENYKKVLLGTLRKCCREEAKNESKPKQE